MRRTSCAIAGALGVAAGCTHVGNSSFQDNGRGSGSGSGYGSGSSVGAMTTCSAPMPIPPLTDPDTGNTCHPSACTVGFCARGDIAPLGRTPATQALQDRLATLDCSPHSIAPLQVFAEADPTMGGKSQLFMYYLLDSTGFQPSVFTTFNRFAVTREIDDGLLAPRFAPSTRGWVRSGTQVTGFSVIPASEGEDADDR